MNARQANPITPVHLHGRPTRSLSRPRCRLSSAPHSRATPPTGLDMVAIRVYTSCHAMPAQEATMRKGTSAGAIVVLIWLLIGTLAAAQRGYFSRTEASCATLGTTAVAIIAGPLNYFGMNPKLECEAPRPSQ